MALNGLIWEETPATARHWILAEEIHALPVINIENGRACVGPVVRLPSGAELFDFREGLDAETLHVRCNGFSYIVFRDDLKASGSATDRPFAYRQTA